METKQFHRLETAFPNTVIFLCLSNLSWFMTEQSESNWVNFTTVYPPLNKSKTAQSTNLSDMSCGSSSGSCHRSVAVVDVWILCCTGCIIPPYPWLMTRKEFASSFTRCYLEANCLLSVQPICRLACNHQLLILANSECSQIDLVKKRTWLWF